VTDHLPLSNHWQALAARLGFDAYRAHACYRELSEAYSEVHRHYHTLEHISECIALWERYKELCLEPDEVLLAIWYHDAVYDPRQRDNEERSAAWAAKDLRMLGLAPARIARVEALIRATQFHKAVMPDERVLLDIDLAILGAPPERFARYDRDIRHEYEHVPYWPYALGRRKVLKGFLAREKLYLTPAIAVALGTRARANLQAAVSFPRWFKVPG
jgi:predicted metal-dependent HD superfamily phosphohydrolase